MPSWEETEHYEIISEEVEDLPEITSSGKKTISNIIIFMSIRACGYAPNKNNNFLSEIDMLA